MRRHTSLLVAVALLGSAAPAAWSQRPDTAMIGAWGGTAHITVPWTAQRELPVRVTIRADGSVVGSVGDAQLVNARFFSARGPVSRALRLGHEYDIRGTLSGPLILSEGIRRESVCLSLDWKDRRFAGELKTSGTDEGSPDQLALVAKGIVLERVESVISLRRP